MSTISSIVYRPKDLPAKPKDHYTRVTLDSALLVENYGIEGDSNGGHPGRHVNIMSRETLDVLTEKGFMTGPGEMGEQVVIEGLDGDLNTLAAGTRLQIGSQAIIEIVKPRTGCGRFEAIQGLSPTVAADQMGQMAEVIQGGTIKVGDSVKILVHV